MYAATGEEAVQDFTIITCTLLIHFSPIVSLFDSSSTHTFIAKTFVDRIRVLVEDLGFDFVVSTLVRVVHTTGECLRGVDVVIQ